MSSSTEKKPLRWATALTTAAYQWLHFPKVISQLIWIQHTPTANLFSSLYLPTTTFLVRGHRSQLAVLTLRAGLCSLHCNWLILAYYAMLINVHRHSACVFACACACLRIRVRVRVHVYLQYVCVCTFVSACLHHPAHTVAARQIMPRSRKE